MRSLALSSKREDPGGASPLGRRDGSTVVYEVHFLASVFEERGTSQPVQRASWYALH